MRPLPVWTLALLTAPVVAQVPRLVDTIAAPVAYLCLEAMPPATGGTTSGAGREAGPVQKLLADPSLDALFGSPAAAASASGSTRALALVRGVLARSSGELELVLTGIVPSAGQPLLVLRARLQRDQADSLQMALDANELAAPARRLGGRTTYRLHSETKATGPGQEVELALVGADLVVGNDSMAMQEVLEPGPAVTSAQRASKALAGDTRFVAMRQRLPIAPGALWMYGDWQRLGQRIEGSLEGLPGLLMGSSGLGSARAVMASVAAAQTDFTATLLLDFDGQPVARQPGPVAGPGRDGRSGPPRPRDREYESGFDGWFAAVQPVAARSLLAELPSGGLGGLVLSVDLASVAGRSHDGAHLLRDLHRAFDEYGLDFQRNLLSRLGARGTVQLHVGRGDGAATVDAVYAVRTRNKKAATDLFADLRRVCEPAGLGIASVRDVKDREGNGAGRERRVVELLELRANGPKGRGGAMFVAALEDSLLVSADDESLVALVDDLRRDDPRRSGKPRGKRVDGTAAAIAAIGGENVAGLFDVDLQPLFDQLTAALVGSNVPADLSALPKRHVGFLDLQPRDGGTFVRVRVLSSR